MKPMLVDFCLKTTEFRATVKINDTIWTLYTLGKCRLGYSTNNVYLIREGGGHPKVDYSSSKLLAINEAIRRRGFKKS